MTTSNDKPRAATETADALNAAILKQARSLTDANIKYETATSEIPQVTALGWDIIALDLKRWGSSDLTLWRAQVCERQAAALRERFAS